MKRAASSRERVLLGLGLLALVANYAIWRLPVHVRALRAARAEAATLAEERARLRGVALGPGAGAEPEVLRLRSELSELRRLENQERARLADPAEAGDLAVRVSVLAHRAGLRLESEEDASPPAPATAGSRAPRAPRARSTARPTARTTSAAAADEAQPHPGDLGPFLAERPQRRWTFRGGFAALWRFLEQLGELPWRVTVLRLEVERTVPLPGRTAPGRPGGGAPTPLAPLRVRMTVAL